MENKRIIGRKNKKERRYPWTSQELNPGPSQRLFCEGLDTLSLMRNHTTRPLAH